MKQLKYEDVIKFPCSPINSIMGISFTSFSDEQSLVDCVVKEYCHGVKSNGQISLGTYKLQITPVDKKFCGRAWYTSDINNLIVKHNPEYERLRYPKEVFE